MTEAGKGAGAAISAQGLSFFYQPGSPVIEDLSFSVKRGEIFAILGQNGCGKTTLLRLILGLLKPASGRVEAFGATAMVPQLFQAVFSFTAMDMVLMGRARQIGLFSRPSKKDERIALSAMERLGVEALARRPFPELSGGQRQLIMLARALTSEADILVLDEPASSLDLGNQGLLINQIRRLSHNDGLTVVFSTHLPQHAMAVADEALVMPLKGGYLSGPASEVLTNEVLSGLYGAVIKRVSVEHGGAMFETMVTLYPEES
jgi:iron complex transport system ATP-binding protein